MYLLWILIRLLGKYYTQYLSQYIVFFLLNILKRYFIFYIFIIFNVYSSLGLAVPPRVRFLQKWKKAKEAKTKEKETLNQTLVDNISEKLNKLSDSEVSDDEPELARPSFKKESFNFHDGNF